MDPVNVTLVLVVLAGAVALFATEKYPVDFVAVLVLGVVMVLGLVRGIVTPAEAVSGFSNPATITVGAMFVISAGLQRTGAVRTVGRALIRLGRWPLGLLAAVMLAAAGVSAFINNTAAVAVFLPLVLAVCARHKFSPSKFLIPMSYASQFGGVCTLIGTSTNLLVSSIAARHGVGAFSMFEFARLGLIMVGAGLAFFFVAGYWLLPKRRGEQLTEAYQLGEYITELRVMPESPLIGKTVTEQEFGAKHDVTVLELLREKEKLWSAQTEPLREGDVLLVRGKMQNLMDLKATATLEIAPHFKLRDEALETEELTLVEALVAPRSNLVGHTLKHLEFRHRYNAIVLGLQRRGEPLRDKLGEVQLESSDTLLLLGPKDKLATLRTDENFILLEEIAEPALRRHKVPLALGIAVAVVALAAMNILPIMASAILGCAALVITRCLKLEEAYEAIDWKVIFLLAGVLPLGIAMENSGMAEWLAKHSLGAVGHFGPVAVLAVLYLVTAVLTEFISNNAAAVLLAPIAISTAAELGVSPKPFLVAVCFAASTAFATPVGYQTNAMIHTPGGYKFTDFTKVGIPLIAIFCTLAVYFIPKFWPF
jgi:di/tricarboxylate transporter